MTLLQMYQGFRDALVHGRMAELPEYVDADAYTENCVGLTGWTVGLDVALANFQFGIAGAFSELSSTQQDLVESDGMLVIRSRNAGRHTGTFLGVPATGRRVEYDSVDMYRAGADGRIAWRFLLCDWNGVRGQLLGEPAPSETPVRYAAQAPAGHPLGPPTG
jgi:predicted ester cyclase